jgi:hypothetical protein
MGEPRKEGDGWWWPTKGVTTDNRSAKGDYDTPMGTQ